MVLPPWRSGILIESPVGNYSFPQLSFSRVSGGLDDRSRLFAHRSIPCFYSSAKIFKMGSLLKRIVNFIKSLLGIGSSDKNPSGLKPQASDDLAKPPEAPDNSAANAQQSIPAAKASSPAEAQPQPRITAELRQLIYHSFYSLDRGDRWVDVAHLGNLLRRHDANFSAQAFGFPNLSKLLEAVPQLVEFERSDRRARLYAPADTKALLQRAYEAVSSKNDWVHLSSFKLEIVKLQDTFSVPKYGYNKFKDFVAYHTDLFELRKDESAKGSPAYYVRLRKAGKSGGKDAPRGSSSQQNGIDAKPKPKLQKNKIISLLSYAFIPAMAERYQVLAELALPEQWYFGGSPPPSFRYPILKNYLEYTFIRLQREGKVFVSTDGYYSTFNTGLLDRKYEPIYALFGLDRQGRDQEWYLIDFCIPGQDQAGKTLANNFTPLPASADYFTRPDEMFYDIHAGVPQVDWLHIIQDHPERLPLAFLQAHCPRNFELCDFNALSSQEKKAYQRQFAAAINNDSRAFRAMKAQCESALHFALLKTQLNYRNAIPYYNPKHDRLQLLLPLALMNDDTVDCALVVSREDAAKPYIGHTILPLSWAYRNTRLVIRIESPWLNTGHSDAAAETNDSDDDYADDDD